MIVNKKQCLPKYQVVSLKIYLYWKAEKSVTHKQNNIFKKETGIAVLLLVIISKYDSYLEQGLWNKEIGDRRKQMT